MQRDISGGEGGPRRATGRLILSQALVLDAFRRRALRRDIVIDSGFITEVSRPRARGGMETVLDASGLMAIPGLVNAHTHAHNNLLKGTGDCRSLEMHTNMLAGALLKHQFHDHYLSAALGALDMLKSGTTCAYDMATIADGPDPNMIGAVVQAYADIGLRATIAPTFADLPWTDGVPGLLDRLPIDIRETIEQRVPQRTVNETLQMVATSIRRWDGAAGGRIRMAVGPNIPGLCTDQLLRESGALSRRLGVGLHTHALESKLQALQSVERYGSTVVERLSNLKVLGPASTLAHGVWMTGDDIRLVARSGTSLVHNPASNMKLGSGMAPVRECLDAGMNVALGTDGSASSDNQNMFRALWLAALMSHVRGPDLEGWITSREVLEMATTRGAKAVGLGGELGAIKAGRRADIVLLKLASLPLVPLNNAFNQLVYAETGDSVQTVIVGGRIVLENGRSTLVDEDRLIADAVAAADRLRVVNRRNTALAEAIEPHIQALHGRLLERPYPVGQAAGQPKDRRGRPTMISPK